MPRESSEERVPGRSVPREPLETWKISPQGAVGDLEDKSPGSHRSRHQVEGHGSRSGGEDDLLEQFKDQRNRKVPQPQGTRSPRTTGHRMYYFSSNRRSGRTGEKCC